MKLRRDVSLAAVAVVVFVLARKTGRSHDQIPYLAEKSGIASFFTSRWIFRRRHRESSSPCPPGTRSTKCAIFRIECETSKQKNPANRAPPMCRCVSSTNRAGRSPTPGMGCYRRTLRPLVVTYSIEWDDPGPFNSQLNAHHAFLNFAEILMYLPDRRGEATVVQFDDVPASWHIAVELPLVPDASAVRAEGYDQLVDAPAESGKFEEFRFDQGGAHFRVVVDGKDWNTRSPGKFAETRHCLRNKTDGRRTVSGIYVLLSFRPVSGSRWWRDGAFELHGDLGVFG